ncbi:hypothetical protein M0R72_06620 [Candidatus Pacearchaeota archaeon]|jgi:uncharacterized protein YoxC|nr:hypothetical protein [Candidatus Pacearchaeota archaeon]
MSNETLEKNVKDLERTTKELVGAVQQLNRHLHEILKRMGAISSDPPTKVYR